MLGKDLKRNSGLMAIALVLVFAVVTFFLTRPVQGATNVSSISGLMSLRTAAQGATPYAEAIANGKPTLIEFYADWCTTCQAMAPTLEEAQQKYAEDLNFVMLNIDEPQWQIQVETYKVNGVPHFVLLEKDLAVNDTFIGKIPAQILSKQLDKLLT